MDTQRDAELLRPLMTQGRFERLEKCLDRRTKWITVVLADLYHEHNMSAVVRSCEAFGIQELHVIELSNPFRPNPGVALGAEQWITIKRYSKISICFDSLRRLGYKILCADPPRHAKDFSYLLSEIPLADGPVALVFGRERDGLHPEARRLCDGRFYIPMVGLTESLNVSVTVGISLYQLRRFLEEQVEPEKWRLSQAERLELLDLWALRSVRKGQQVLKRLRGG